MARIAERRRCPTCRTRILAGDDQDRADGWIFPSTADPQPIDELGEAIALIAGRRTFDLSHDTKLTYRSSWHIRQPRRRPVLAEHACGQQLPAARPDCPGLPNPNAELEEPNF